MTDEWWPRMSSAERAIEVRDLRLKVERLERELAEAREEMSHEHPDCQSEGDE